MADFPLGIMDPFSKWLGCIDIIVIVILLILLQGVLLGLGSSSLVHFVASLVAVHFLDFSNRNVIEILHYVLVCINDFMPIFGP